jgi:cation:H+ antiporter
MLPALAAVVVGLALLVWSADRFVEGAAATSARLGLPPLLIGMLVIGFGTSAPELVVSAIAASDGNPGLALGNAYGSNIANIGLILGLVAVVSPLMVNSSVVRRELPVLGLVTLVSALFMIGGMISRLEGVLLLLGLAAFMAISVFIGLRSGRAPIAGESEALVQSAMSLRKGLIWTLIGLVLLIVSSRLLVWGAVEIAVGFGVSDLIIGLTVVAIGTSLPELASSISALRRKEHDMVLGNVVGSNLFNTLGVVGLAAVIAPIEVGREVLLRDWGVMMAMTVLLAVFAIGWRAGRPGRINRLEGGVLLAMYVAYTCLMVYLVISAARG